MLKVAADFMASELLGHPAREQIVLNEEALLASVDAYFLISEAYKAERLKPGRKTQPPKIAALSALAFAHTRPLRIAPDAPPVVDLHSNALSANGLFSLYWASNAFEQDFGPLFAGKLKPEVLARYFRMFRRLRLSSISGFIADIDRGEVREAYDILLDHDGPGNHSPLSDLPKLDTMILIFEPMWEGTGSLED